MGLESVSASEDVIGDLQFHSTTNIYSIITVKPVQCATVHVHPVPINSGEMDIREREG